MHRETRKTLSKSLPPAPREPQGVLIEVLVYEVVFVTHN